MKACKRVFLIVLDSFGIGAEPDAAEFGDGDVNTLRTIAASPAYATPHLAQLGLSNIGGGVSAASRYNVYSNRIVFIFSLHPIEHFGGITYESPQKQNLRRSVSICQSQ